MVAGGFLAAGFVLPEAVGLPPAAGRTLGILLFAVVLWASEALPLSVTALLGVGLLAVSGAAPTFGRAAQGFATDTVFFLLAATLLAQAVANAGLIERIARFTMRRSRGLPRPSLWLVSSLTWGSALIMPSALVRTKAFIPVSQRIDELTSQTGGGNFRRPAGLAMALLGPVGSLAVMTGGGMTIVAAGVIAEFHQPITWLTWLTMMALPTAVIAVLTTALLAAVYLRPDAVGPGTAPDKSQLPSRESPGPWRASELVALIVLTLTLVLWMLGGQWNLPLAVPAILAAAVFALPRIRLVTSESINKQKWDEILVVGCGLSLGAALRDTGAMETIVSGAFALFPANIGVFGVYLLTAAFAFGARLMFLQPSPCMVIMLPIVLELALITSTDPLVMAMLAAGVIGSAQLLPIHHPSSLLCYSEAMFRTRDHARIAPAFSAISILVMLLSALLWWPRV